MPDAEQAAVVADEARRLFVENGYGGTTMADVAARCRISKRTLYRLFPGKAELFAAIVEAHRHSMLALPGDYRDLPLADALERIFRIDIGADADRERRALLRLVVNEAGRFPELEAILWTCGAERSRASLASWLAEQRALGRIDTAAPATDAAILMDMIFGPMAYRAGGQPVAANDRDLKAHQRRCIGIFLEGVRPR